MAQFILSIERDRFLIEFTAEFISRRLQAPRPLSANRFQFISLFPSLLNLYAIN